MRNNLHQISLWRSLHKSNISNVCIILAAFCSILSITSGHPLEVNKCGIVRNSINRIVGGITAQDGSYPWMVSIQEFDHGWDHLCGASIINEHWIVTAAHCISHADKPWLYEAYVGVHQLSKKERQLSRSYKISKIIVHEDYGYSFNNQNDIALMRTLKPIDIAYSRGYVNGICLPDSDEDPEGWAIVTGWGIAYYGGKDISDELQIVRVPIVPRKMCNMAYDDDLADGIDENIPETQICAGDTFKDSCQADSGGPLIQRDRNGVHTLIGIVSYGYGCGEKYYPGVYTKVASYLEWMEANMSDN